MSAPNAFDLSENAAQTYENQRVPAIFGPMAEATLNAIELPTCKTILDVACGTGAMARAVAARLTEPCRIVGCDLNHAMIDVARANTNDGIHSFEWVAAPVQSMPFCDGDFDLAFCQHGLQFFPDKPAALRETRRVLGVGAMLVISCWRAVPPFFEVVADVYRTYLDETAATTAIRPFIWNDAEEIGNLISEAGFDCQVPKGLPVARRMPADQETMVAEILATPNEAALRASGQDSVELIASEILKGAEVFRQGETLVMPQEAHLFVAIAR
ncbi:methyltransferase domain-containing protein [Martelella alba]|uniref:Methyltransferase domain-containing protein n=1 Tax=Martelella alba TaxID=2590451 RepID=A0A506U0R8_9HYPH|nr:methyltransferase domain-containing protein [Martelella alba]TPW26199.1 methyltransferase domain-containing protein [Martelella alba]